MCQYEEKHKDLFEVSKEYHLAHCIATDALMGAGIAVPMKKKFGLSKTITAAKRKELKVGTCYPDGRVLNLLTKSSSYGKPTKQSFEAAIVDMRRVVIEREIKKIAMPLIGAGLDRLSWGSNREVIQRVFADVDVEILVCRK